MKKKNKAENSVPEENKKKRFKISDIVDKDNVKRISSNVSSALKLFWSSDKNKKLVYYLAAFIVLTVILRFAVIGVIFAEDKLPYQVVLDVQTSADDTLTLYYDNGKSSRFDDEHCVSVDVSRSSVYQNVTFEIPAGEKIDYLKLYLSTRKNVTFKFRSISIQSLARKVKFEYTDVDDVFSVTNNTGAWSEKDGGYSQIKATKSYAYMTNTSPINSLSNRSLRFIMSASLSVLLISVAGVLISLKKKNDESSQDIVFIIITAVAFIAVVVLSIINKSLPGIVLCITGAVLVAALLVLALIRIFKTSEKPRALMLVAFVLLLAVVCGPIIISPFLSGAEEEPVPSMSVQSFNEFSGKFTNYFKGSSAVSSVANLYSDTKILLFGESLGEDVIVGTNGWLFDKNELSDFKRLNSFDTEELSSIEKYLENIERTLKANGIKMYVLIVPDKINVYDKYMPSNIRQTSRAHRIPQIYSHLYKYTDIGVAEVYDLLCEKASKSNTLYYKADNYLSQEGAFYVAEALIDKIAADFDSLDLLYANNYTVSNGKTKANDLAALLGYPNSFVSETPYYTIKSAQTWDIEPLRLNPHLNYDTSEPETLDFNDVFGRGMIDESSACGNDYEYCEFLKIANHDAENDLKVCVLRDEYSTNLVSYIASVFSESTFIMSESDWTVKSIIAEDPDVFVFEISERYLDNWID